jgi:amidophosphoribosyltransferase
MAGLFGVADKTDCSKELYYGTDYHSHLAADWAGIALYTGPEEKIFKKSHQIENVPFKIEFSNIREKTGQYGIGALSNERQPLGRTSRLGDFAIATNSTIFNLEDLLKEIFDTGGSLSEATASQVNNTEVIAQLICQQDSILDGISYAMNKVDGFCSILLMDKTGIYAARDKFGIDSLVLGKRDGAIAVTSETSAFANLGFKIEKYLVPGEIVKFDENGHNTMCNVASKLKLCVFYFTYFSDPGAMHEDVNVEFVRNNCGAALADKDFERGIKADLVCPVADSGTGHAIGYANRSKIPFGRALTKFTAGWSRSYMPPNQKTRDEIAYFKQIPNVTFIKDKKIVIVDDSIRRGTQLRNLLKQKLWPLEPAEIHVRIASPPQLYPCIRDPKDASRLAARRAIRAIENTENLDGFDFSEYLVYDSEKYNKMVNLMAKELTATTLDFISLEDAVKATGLPKESFCLYCWDGKKF